jgi:methyl-accepting chemotaxis protein
MVMLQDISADAALLRTRHWQGGALSLAGMLALTAVLSLFMRRAVVGRVRTIARVSSEIERGNYAVSFTDESRDELGVLSANLAAMVSTIRNQLEYNKSVLGGIIVPLAVMDKAGRIEFANQPMCAILGSPCKNLMGLSLHEVLEKGGTDCSLQCDPVAQVLSTGTSTSGMLRFVRRDGVAFPLHYEASPLRDTDGKAVGAIAVMIDLTQEEEDKVRIETQRRNLLEVAEEVTGVARALSDAAGELSVRMGELARNVVESTDETAQVATAMDEMNATVMEVTRNASATAEAADLANREAQQGGAEMQATVSETRQVAERAAGLAASLNDLAARADNIGRVIDVINEIADQTNLLALNAAIEAARAGDAGRGFAVVADEVRKLAEKTMTATKEVERAIADIQTGTAQAVDEMTRARPGGDHGGQGRGHRRGAGTHRAARREHRRHGAQHRHRVGAAVGHQRRDQPQRHAHQRPVARHRRPHPHGRGVHPRGVRHGPTAGAVGGALPPVGPAAGGRALPEFRAIFPPVRGE